MERALAYLLLALLAGLAAAALVRRARPAAVAIVSLLIRLASCFAWYALQYFQVVPVDSLLRQTFGVESHQLVGTRLGALVLFGPPLPPSIVMLCRLFLIRRRRPPP